MTTFVTREKICSAVKLNVLFEGVGGEVVKLVLQWRHRKFDYEPRVVQKLDPCTQDSLCN